MDSASQDKWSENEDEISQLRGRIQDVQDDLRDLVHKDYCVGADEEKYAGRH